MCNVSLKEYLRDFTKRAGLRIGSSASRLFISFVVLFMQVLPTGFLGPQQEQGPVSVRFAWHPRSSNENDSIASGRRSKPRAGALTNDVRDVAASWRTACSIL